MPRIVLPNSKKTAGGSGLRWGSKEVWYLLLLVGVIGAAVYVIYLVGSLVVSEPLLRDRL